MSGPIVNPNGRFRAGYYLNAATVYDNDMSDHLEGEVAQAGRMSVLGDKIEHASL